MKSGERSIKLKKSTEIPGLEKKKNNPSSRIRISDLRMTSFTLQSSALPTELSKDLTTINLYVKGLKSFSLKKLHR